MFVCECGKKFEKNNSLNAHFSHCLIHRKGKPPIDRFGEKRAWNKGLTKETDERVKKLSIINSREHHPNWGKHLSRDHKEKLSRSLKGKTGGMRSGSNKWKGQYIFYNDQKIWLDSSWEKKFVDHLISLNIKWVKNTNKWGFKYKFNDRFFTYYPDFFLPDLNIWIEIKGMEKEKDKFKWEQFPAKLIILKSIKEIEDFYP